MKEYDFGLSWSTKTRDYFTRTLKSACQNNDLSFLWVTDNNVREVIKKLEGGQMRIKVLLDTEATYDKPRDPYSRVCYAVKDRGGMVINDPDRTKVAVDKSVMYYELVSSGINTPYSVVVRNWHPKTFKLADDERKKLGVPFVIKPACGYGQRGLVKDASGTVREIARARNFDRGDNFLLQEKINPIELKNKRAWFRVLHVFDKIIPCWWDDRTCRYEHVTEQEYKNYHLSPLAKIVSKIAYITEMVWFSTEIAIDKKLGQPRFVAIDYVNDQCDMTAKSESQVGVPNYIVRLTAYSIVHAAQQSIKRKRKKAAKKYTVLLRKGSLKKARGLGFAPELLTQVPV